MDSEKFLNTGLTLIFYIKKWDKREISTCISTKVKIICERIFQCTFRIYLLILYLHSYTSFLSRIQQLTINILDITESSNWKLGKAENGIL